MGREVGFQSVCTLHVVLLDTRQALLLCRSCSDEECKCTHLCHYSNRFELLFIYLMFKPNSCNSVLFFLFFS